MLFALQFCVYQIFCMKNKVRQKYFILMLFHHEICPHAIYIARQDQLKRVHATDSVMK